MSAVRADDQIRVPVEIRGAAARLFTFASGEIIISGPAGTGKTRAILEWIHMRASTEKLRVLLLRKTLESLKASALVTYQEQVLYDFDGKSSLLDGVTYFGGNTITSARFNYAESGSVVVLGGMDRLSKVLSTEYDIIFVNECTELTLDQWEQLSGRTDRPRLGKQRPPSLVLGDCNPDRPTHWIKTREAEKKLKLWTTTHRDNPAMWDRLRQCWTEAGQRYLARLETLTGVRRDRLLHGKWVSAEGIIYTEFQPDTHVIPPFEIPWDWTRYWVIDFGYTNPFVWQWWAEDPDGRLYLYREIYKTGVLVEDHARRGLALSAGEPAPAKVICDHDAEDRATFEKHTRYRTVPAHKTVSDGIQAVKARLAPTNGKPRLFIVQGARIDRDEALAAVGKPTSTEEEHSGYVWDERVGQRRGDVPLKENDHGMDTERYMVADRDLPDDGAMLSNPTGQLADYLAGQ